MAFFFSFQNVRDAGENSNHDSVVFMTGVPITKGSVGTTTLPWVPKAVGWSVGWGLYYQDCVTRLTLAQA